ncbi:MAG: glycosyltransferase family 4 protein [Patescibacteria group bacterium]
MKKKLAVLVSHPIQYQTPLFKKIVEQLEIDLKVYFCWDFGIKEKYDAEFGRKIKWDIPLLEGYDYKFLKNYSFKPSSDFWGQINPGIISEIYKNKYDAVLIFGWNSLTNWLAFLTAFIIGTPVFLRGENPLNQEILKDSSKLAVKRVILGSLFKFIKAFLYIGQENKKFYQYYGVAEKRLFFAPYAIDNERFMEEAKKLKKEKAKTKKDLKIDAKKSVILFIGKLIDKKRPMDLLKAYEKTKNRKVKKSKQIALIFVGDGHLREELENYTKSNNIKDVYFLGFKNQTEIMKYYSIGDTIVLPSGSGETWGLVLNEAMCFGLPLVISDAVGAGPDLVQNDKNGFIYPVGDIENLYFCLNFIDDKKKIDFFGKNSLKIIKKYSFDNDVKAILGTLKSLKNNLK